VPHVDYVQQRVEQLREYITAIPDWINYAVVDEVTDSFAPLIHQIEHEVENLDEIVLWSAISTPKEQTETVSRIGLCRKRVMQMLRLLSSKSDVIRALIKRFEERSGSSSSPSLLLPDRPRHPDQQQMNNHLTAIIDSCQSTTNPQPIVMDRISPSIVPLHPDGGSPPCPKKGFYSHGSILEENGQIFPDVALYLGDVQGRCQTERTQLRLLIRALF
jgi:Mg2+ and Co2+ transporter CorA